MVHHIPILIAWQRTHNYEDFREKEIKVYVVETNESRVEAILDAEDMVNKDINILNKHQGHYPQFISAIEDIPQDELNKIFNQVI